LANAERIDIAPDLMVDIDTPGQLARMQTRDMRK
jgi:hypothetical protein